MTESRGVMQYRGKGYSPIGDKNRVVLPADFRSAITKASGGSRLLLIDKHPRFDCLVGFGMDRSDNFENEVEKEAEIAQRRGLDFDPEIWLLKVSGFHTATFDESGRFVLPRYLAEQAGIETGVYFAAAGPVIQMWAPEVLGRQSADLDSVKAACRAKIAEFEGREPRGPKR